MALLACASSGESAPVADSVQGRSDPASAAISGAADTGVLRRRVLAIDYGRSRIGLAVSDPLGVTARPLATWTRANRRRDLARLRELCRAHDIGTIIVGWPLRLDGKPGEMAGEAARFAERVGKYIGLRVELVDERLSSWEAGQVVAEGALRGQPLRDRKRRKPLDDVAAAVILRDYLTRGGTLRSHSEQHCEERAAEGIEEAPRSVPLQPVNLAKPVNLVSPEKPVSRGSGRS
jgi:putative Holliday junction resolvase